MDISGCSFSELSYSPLFNTYLTNFDKLSPFYPYNALDEKDLKKRAEALHGAGSKKDAYLSALQKYHKQLGIEQDQKKPLEKLAHKDALVIVTGQQLGLYGGPLYTVYKTLTAILLARKYEAESGKPVVPVFWMADEDHDFDEISWLGILGKNDFHKIKIEQEGGLQPVADEIISAGIQGFDAEIKEHLFDTDFTANLWNQLDAHFREGATFAQAFAGLINAWFAHEGLLIAGSNTKEIKHLVADDVSKSIVDSESIYSAIEQKSAALESVFHRQVINGDSNLFYLSKQKGRVKIHKDGEAWQAGDKKWTRQELSAEIKASPHCFSPNVFLRPILQDKLLPTLGYVAGPGELAYYAQMRDLYAEFELEMPPIIPRLCATLVESGIARIVEKLPFTITDYEKRIEDLESHFVEQAEMVDLEKVFGDWKEKLENAAQEPLQVINEIDATLDATVGKTVAGFSNELDKLKGRVYRSIKQQEKTQINRIEKIKVNLFPDGGLQERAVSPIYFMNKYGLDIWSKLLAKLEENEPDLMHHHFIEL